MMIAICCMLSCFIQANADNGKPINFFYFSVNSLRVLNKHFKHQNVALVRVETGITNKTYDVILQNGTKLEFDKRGNVTEIDCKQGAAVPGKLIPQAISKYLQNNYPRQTVRKIEFNKNEYEVELTNGLDITFNKRFQVTDID